MRHAPDPIRGFSQSCSCESCDSLRSYRLYPIFRRNSFRTLISAGPSIPFGELPSDNSRELFVGNNRQ
jgi:hypothetical protein